MNKKVFSISIFWVTSTRRLVHVYLRFGETESGLDSQKKRFPGFTGAEDETTFVLRNIGKYSQTQKTSLCQSPLIVKKVFDMCLRVKFSNSLGLSITLNYFRLSSILNKLHQNIIYLSRNVWQ